jgi:hypothetical protein
MPSWRDISVISSKMPGNSGAKARELRTMRAVVLIAIDEQAPYMNLQSLRAKLLQVERQRQRLQKRIQTSSKKQLEALPAKVGLKSIDDLILELMPYASPRVRARSRLNGEAEAEGTPGVRKAGRPAKSKGTRYTADTKNAIKAALEKGGMTVAQLSEKYGASSFSINQWKKRWGLTKPRKKK